MGNENPYNGYSNITPPYETAESLMHKLESLYSKVEVKTVESMGCFVCTK